MQTPMQKISPYLRLMRLHQPVGIWLVYWPCLWALALTAPPLRWDLALIILAGAVVARSAGCVINDMADREFDKHVARTRARPLASGELSMRQACGLLALLLVLCGLVLLALISHSESRDLLHWVLLMSPVSAMIVAYPFMKRITWWPQAFLGLTFNWGVLVSWFAARGMIELPSLLLYAACLFWTLGYDTIYGFQDKADDEKIGVKSSSRRVQHHPRLWVGGFYGMMVILFAIAVITAGHTAQLIAVAMLAVHLSRQAATLDTGSPSFCLALFRGNARLGLLVGLALIAFSIS